VGANRAAGADEEEDISPENEVADVIVRYATAIDSKDWPLLGSCFTEDCEAVYRARVFRGVEELVDYMIGVHTDLDGSLHRLTNIVVKLGDDGETATTRSYVDALLVRRSHEVSPTYRVIGSYTDSLVRGVDGWRIAHRDYQDLWQEGDRGMIEAKASQ